MKHQIETFQLHAYLDGELSQQECREVERALKFDESLRQQLKEFKTVKQQIKKTYSQFEVPEKPIQTQASGSWVFTKSAVASLLLGFVIGLGSMNFVGSDTSNSTPTYQAHASNYLIHLDSDRKDKQQKVIAEITALLESVDSSVQVDLISNDKGVELFNVNNPNHLELQKLLGQYDNFALFACKRALDRAAEKGHKLILMPEVNQDKPAIDTVVERLNSGWGYIKI